MKNSLSNLLIFATGAALGSVVTLKLVKTKYERIAQEEIDSVKEVFSRREKETPSKPISDAKIDIPDLKEYADILKETGYNKEADEKQMDIDMPYTISPDEFGEFDDYETITLTYYADDILADDDDELVDDIDETVGLESLKTFGEYEDDCVFVRNDRLKADYEILLDTRNYSDVVGEEE